MTKLTKEEEQLLNTDFGDEIEKIAADRAHAVTEAYDYGFDKYAASVADEMDKLAEEEDKEDKEEDEDEEMDEESEKAAAELGAFIERGFFDGLRKLGSDRHNNELHYLTPYLTQKIAAGKVEAVTNFLKSLPARAQGAASAAKGQATRAGKAVADYHRGAASQVAEGARNIAGAARGKGLQGTGDLAKGDRGRMFAHGAKQLGIGAAKMTPAAAGVGAVGYAGKKALGGKKED